MADNPQTQGRRPRPLSPHLTIYAWPVTMATSILHRLTGVALYAGLVLVAWWLFAVTTGPQAYGVFAGAVASIYGQVILFGFVWALAYHLLNGLRHLAWDLGYGFKVPTANTTGIIVIIGSLVLTVLLFVLAWAGHGGYFQ